MPRRILTPTLTNKQKKTLREFFNSQNNRNDQRIGRIAEYLGVENPYEVLRSQYNENVQRQQRENERRQREVTRRTNRMNEVFRQNQAAAKRRDEAFERRSLLTDYRFNQNPRNDWEENGEQLWEPIEDQLRRIARKLVGKRIVYIQSSFDGQPFKKGIVVIDTRNPDTIYWDKLRPFFQVNGSDIIHNIFAQCEDYAKIVVFHTDTVIPERLQKKYLDGEKHCVIEPIRNIFQQYADNSNSKESRRKMLGTVKRLNELEKEYVGGVPESDLEIIGKAIHRCIVIRNLLGNEIKRYNASSSKYIQFTNTRNNHLDIGFITLQNQYILVSQDELIEIMLEHDREKMFYLFDGDLEGKIPTSLSSSKGNWSVINEEYEIFNEFNKHIGKKNYGLNAVKYSDLNEYIKEGRIINACPVPLCDEPNELEDVHHIDIAKAYTQHRYNKHYRGFLGHIHGYAKLDMIRNPLEFLETHIGMYQFKVISNKNELLQKLGICEKHTYLLPSVEIIAFMVDYGLKIQLISGCWGSSFDFDYTEEMLENRRYCIWAGKLGTDNSFQKFIFTGDREWASHLASELGSENVVYFKELKLIMIKQDKKNYNTYHHILAFITSYTRLNMLDIMKNVQGSLVKVVLDGLYYRGIVEDVVVPHKLDKELKKHYAFREFWYYPSEIDTKHWGKYKPDFDGNCILAGSGGTGKTYSVYHSKTLISPLYVVPSHVLGKKMKEEYGCEYTTIHRLIGDDCVSYKEMFKEPHTIFIDELTMIDKQMILKALEMYPRTLILIAGDINKKQWFQCRNGNGDIYTELFMPNDWRYVEYTTDFRSKDDGLRNLKQTIRNEMVKIFETGGRGEAEHLNRYIAENYPTIPFDTAVQQFHEGDVWIAGTHSTNKKLIKKGIVSGYISNKKEINFSGDGEKRGSFTIHSFQGLTLENTQVFISLDNFEYAMLYTAISRCRYLSQIKFVGRK